MDSNVDTARSKAATYFCRRDVLLVRTSSSCAARAMCCWLSTSRSLTESLSCPARGVQLTPPTIVLVLCHNNTNKLLVLYQTTDLLLVSVAAMRRCCSTGNSCLRERERERERAEAATARTKHKAWYNTIEVITCYIKSE